MKVTDDGFLGSRLMVRQPERGFRSGTDAVILAAAVPAKAGQSVLEIGIGAGVASLCLAARVPGLRHTGLELQPEYAGLARENAALNGTEIDVIEGDIADVPPELAAQSFDHVFMNPPYYRSGAWFQAHEQGRSVSLGETEPLAVWMDAATRRLKPGGWMTIIQKGPRLVDVIRAADDRLGSLMIKPIAPRSGRMAEMFIARFRKGGRADPVLCAPLILHEGDSHKQDAAHPTAAAEIILRDGGILEF